FPLTPAPLLEGEGIQWALSLIAEGSQSMRVAPMQKRCWSERRYRWPLAIAGVARIVSPSALVATSSGLSPSLKTLVKPSLLTTYSLPSAITGEAQNSLPLGRSNQIQLHDLASSQVW